MQQVEQHALLDGCWYEYMDAHVGDDFPTPEQWLAAFPHYKQFWMFSDEEESKATRKEWLNRHFSFTLF
jgi:hypothetical protein